MTDTPDLVLRAAARLAKSAGAQPLPTSGALNRNNDGNGTVPPQPTIRAIGPGRSTLPEGLPKRSVHFSPATLATNGIALPSAGFSRRVEEFRSIKRQVLTTALRGGSSGNDLDRVVMVTSATPGNGKTYISINLALSIAFERDLSVILIDADAHRQSMLSYLGISADKGWLDVLADDSLNLADVIFETNVPGLTVIPAGKARPEIPELLSSRKMTTLITDLAKSNPNRLIILDTLPCLVSTEPTILASIVGQALFVVAANETSKDEIETSLHLIERCPNVSLVLNKGNPLLIDQYGKYGYGYGYQDSAQG